MSFIVAIDGPAGSGKGTITKLVGKNQNLINIDTGAMYRCVSLEILNKNVKLDDIEKINEILKSIDIDFKKVNDEDRFFLNGIDVSKKIREKEVNEIVSQVSHIPTVRTSMVDLQRKMAIGKDVIMEGRDIGTNVFPNADIKIYLDASAEERANRRMKQNKENGINIPFEEILANIIYRDTNDKNSSVAPLKKAEDAIYIDSTNLSIEEVTKEIEDIIAKKRK